MKRILLATDFSTRSDRAIRRATLLAKQFNLELLLLHVVDDDQPAHMTELEEKAAYELLEKLSETIRQTDGVACNARIMSASAFEGIVRTSHDINVELIVIGSHRRQVLRDVFAGTTAERVMKMSSKPVLMVNAVPAGPYRKILVPVDFSDCSAEALKTAERLRPMDGGALTVLNVFDTSVTRGRTGAFMSHDEVARYSADAEANARAELSDFLAVARVSPDKTLLEPNELSTHLVIDAEARKMSVDLIAIGTHGRSGIARMALGSVTTDLINITECDVLVIPPASTRGLSGVQ